MRSKCSFSTCSCLNIAIILIFAAMQIFPLLALSLSPFISFSISFFLSRLYFNKLNNCVLLSLTANRWYFSWSQNWSELHEKVVLSKVFKFRPSKINNCKTANAENENREKSWTELNDWMIEFVCNWFQQLHLE